MRRGGLPGRSGPTGAACPVRSIVVGAFGDPVVEQPELVGAEERWAVERHPGAERRRVGQLLVQDARARLAGDRDPAARVEDAGPERRIRAQICLLYTSDAADERSSVDLGGR